MSDEIVVGGSLLFIGIGFLLVYLGHPYIGVVVGSITLKVRKLK
jgi:ABC-type Co2+ transport system permease subunit